MKLRILRYRLLSLLVAVSGLAIACSHSGHTNERTTQPSHADHAATAEAASTGHEHPSDHAASPATQAKLISTAAIAPNQPTPITLEIQDRQGQAIPKFDRFQEKLMHLIVVSNDLQFFSHIHPEYKQKGRFEVAITLPKAGKYTLFSDYKPAGEAEAVSTMPIQAAGSPPASPDIDLSRTKTLGDLNVNLDLSQSQPKAKQPVTLTFNLQTAQTRQPVTDLQPYLGERGHLVILKQSPALSRADYIHAHALPVAQEGQVQFKTTFPEAGRYKLWGQFNHNGQIVTTDFWLEVS